MNHEYRAAAVLFDGFETVFYSKVPLPSSSGKLPQQDGEVMDAPFAYLIESVKAAGEHAAGGMLAGSEAILVGAKDFRAPEGLGGVQSRFCYIVVLSQQNKFDFAKQFKGPRESLEGLEVWKWQAPLFEEAPSTATIYAAQIEGVYLVVSNSLSELQSVSLRLKRPAGESQTLRSLRGWQSINRGEFWAYRRYRRSQAADQVAAGMVGIPQDAEALVFSVDLEKRVAVLRLLGPAGSEAGRKSITINSAMPALDPRELGAWEARIAMFGDEQTVKRLFVVMGMFGFGVYL